MRITCRNTAYGWDVGITTAMVTMGVLVLVIFLNLLDRPLSANATESDAPTDTAFFPENSVPPYVPPTSGNAVAVLPANVATATPAKVVEIKIYQGQKYRFVKTMVLRVTAYAPDRRCTFPYDGTTTASGLSVKTNGGHLVAADTAVIPMHALVIVPGYAHNAPVPVLDRGGAIQGHRLDVLLPTYNQAQAWGVRMLTVKIYEPL
jgi:3D (Asp-Asp-Asp) domain-containing protein